MARPSPVSRVRERFASLAGSSKADQLPRRYERFGSVLALRLAESLRPEFPVIGRLWQEEMGVETVIRHDGRVEGEWRIPRFEPIAGDSTEVEVREHGIRYRFDAARILFSPGNQAERGRAGRLVRPGERVADLFAGIGYFALPAAVAGRASRVDACEMNPLSLHYLAENARLNGVSRTLVIHPGDNRETSLEPHAFDRVFLGYLPTAVGFLHRALPLLRPEGGWVHVHLITDSGRADANARDSVEREVHRLDGTIVDAASRPVKAYGPGRTHVVVDARVIPS